MAVLVVSMCSAAPAFGAGVSRRSSTTDAVLVEMGGWRMFARHASDRGSTVHLSDVQASRGDWVMAADSLVIRRASCGPEAARWMWAWGHLRLAGPDDMYVISTDMFTVDPTAELVFVGADRSPSLLAGHWRLDARRIQVDLAAHRTRLVDLRAQPAR